MKQRYQLTLDRDNGSFISKESVKKKLVGSDSSVWLYLGLVGQIGFVIAVPIAGGAFLGVQLDKKWGTYPKATLALLLAGVLLSLVNFVRTIKLILKKN